MLWVHTKSLPQRTLASLSHQHSLATLAVVTGYLFVAPVAVATDEFAHENKLTRSTPQKEATAVSLDIHALEQLRVDAIARLPQYHNQSVASTLIHLTDQGQPITVRCAAFEALAKLTGIVDLGHDRDKWQQWWGEHRTLSPSHWHQRLLDNFANYAERLVQRQEWTLARLIEAQRKVYRSESAANRPNLLIQMLDDRLEGIRSLAIDIMSKELINGEPPGEKLRQTLIELLADPSPNLRHGAARLLHELNEERAATVVAQKIAAGQETAPNVFRTYLLLLTKMPRPEAAETALHLLDNPQFCGEAADLLASAAEKQMLEVPQVNAALKKVRALITGDRLPEPQFVTLLGVIGSDAEWKRIEGWLDNPDTRIREAAAEAWARSDRLLEPLAVRAGDSIIQPIVIEAAIRRGNQRQTLMALIDHKPRQQQPAKAWQEALIQMVRRIAVHSPHSAVDAQTKLVELNESLTIQDMLLTAAIGVIATRNDLPQLAAHRSILVELLLRRATIRSGKTDPQAAIEDYKHIAMLTPLDDEHQHRYIRGLMAARLDSNYIEGAIELAEQILKADQPLPTSASIGRVGSMFLDAAEKALDAGQTDQTDQILRSLAPLLGDKIPANLIKRYNDLEARRKLIELSTQDNDKTGKSSNTVLSTHNLAHREQLDPIQLAQKSSSDFLTSLVYTLFAN